MCRSANGAVSTDVRFFRDMMRNGSKVGLAHFEQDYLCASTAATSRDLDTGTRWFRALDAAVCENLLFLPLSCTKNDHYAKDRLGTNIGKALGRRHILRLA